VSYLKQAKMLSFSKYLNILFACFLLILVTSIIILSYVPPVSRDALTHHLAVTKLYLKHGGIYCYALFGVLLFLSLPVIIKLSITVYVDLGLYYFSTASLVYLFKWIEKEFKIKYLIFAAIWCGLALGTKYNGLIVLFLLTLFVPFIYLRSIHSRMLSQGRAIGYGAIFMIVSLIVFSPWMIKNYIWTSNPIYPLYNKWFNTEKIVSAKEPDTDSSSSVSSSSDVVKKPRGRWGHFAVRKIVYGEKWWETAAIPVRVFFQGKDDNPKFFDGRLNPLLFILPFFAFIKLKKNIPILRTEKKILVMFSVLFLLFVFFQTDMRIRWIGPIIPPLVILSAFGLNEMITAINKRCSETFAKILKGCVIVFITFLVSLNAFYIIGLFKVVEPMSYISGRVGRDEYIEKYRPEYAVINYANHNFPSNAKIMCMFLGNRSYYIDREVVFSYGLASKEVIQEYSSEKILVDLKKRNITHLLVRYDLFSKWLHDNYNEMEKEVIRKFIKKKSELLYSKNGYGLYQLKNHTFEES